MGRVFNLIAASAALFTLLGHTGAQGAEPLNITTSHYPQPSQERFQSWVDRFFESDELWRFKDRKTFEAIVDSTVSDPSYQQELKALYKDTINMDDVIKTSVHYELEGPGGFVFVPQRLREKASRNFLQRVYSSQFETYGTEPSLAIHSPNLRGIEEFLNHQHFPADVQAIALNNTVRLNGNYFLLITPHTWSLFPENVRRSVVKNSVHPDLVREGVKARLVIHRKDNLSEIAKKYAGERDPRPIERYLRLVLGTSESAEVPLEKIMHPFIRKMLDTYPACHGPNCYNSGLNVNRGNAYRVESVADENTLLKQVYSKYRFVKTIEPLQSGDLLAYSDLDGRVVHVATYVDENLVFTKNGLSKLNPYIFQDVSAMEHVYFPDGGYRLMAFRTVKPPEVSISKDPDYQGKIFYRQQPKRLSAPKLLFDFDNECFLNTLNSKLEHAVRPIVPGQ